MEGRTHKEWYDDTKLNCDCGGVYNPETHSKHIKTQMHLDFINKGLVSKKGKSNSINCECGGHYTIKTFSQHKQSQIHKLLALFVKK